MSIDASPERRKLFERVYTTHCCNGHSRSALEPMPNTRSPLAGHFVDPEHRYRRRENRPLRLERELVNARAASKFDYPVVLLRSRTRRVVYVQWGVRLITTLRIGLSIPPYSQGDLGNA
jgi:hypothetical protein